MVSLRVSVSLALALSACVRGTPLPPYDIDVFRVEATRPDQQVRAGGLAPVVVEVHNNGNGAGQIDLECRIGSESAVGSVPVEAFLQRAHLTYRRVIDPAIAPVGPQQVTCLARVRGDAGTTERGRSRVTANLVIERPALPDYVLIADSSRPTRAFDCESSAPPVVGRSACISFEARNRSRREGAEPVEGPPRVRCTIDGHDVSEQPSGFHSGSLALGTLSLGAHAARCTIDAPQASFEADTSNNDVAFAFDVLADVDWKVDVAASGVDLVTHTGTVTQNGPGSDSPPRRVSAVVFGVRVTNVGHMRVFAIDASCATNRGVTFTGTWARAGSDEWARGLDPGESTLVEVATPVSIAPGDLDVTCDVLSSAPRGVVDANAGDNRQVAVVTHR